jgi:hypothetical protein
MILLHFSPQTSEIYIHELDPQMTFKYSQSIVLPKGDITFQMQVVDNLIVVHNFADKSSHLYDIKLAEYTIPICVDNLDIDTSFYAENYHSDTLFEEENVQEEKPEEEAKEYFEINFKFNYTGEDDTPINLGIDLGQIEKEKEVNTRKAMIKTVDMYDTQHMLYVEPMFVIDTKNFCQFTFKLNLQKLIEKQRNMCRQAICLLNRANNKTLCLQYVFSLLVNKKLNLYSASMIFMKIC